MPDQQVSSLYARVALIVGGGRKRSERERGSQITCTRTHITQSVAQISLNDVARFTGVYITVDKGVSANTP